MEPLPSNAAAITDTFDQHEELDAARAFFDAHGGSIPLSAFAQALQAAGVTIPSEAPAGAAIPVMRSDLGIALPIDIGLPIAAAPAMRAARVSGPFRGATGLFWLHFYLPAQSWSIFKAGETQPRLVVTKGSLPAASTSKRLQMKLDGGTVWILASTLDPSFPSDAYLGFTVKSGTLAFSRTPKIDADRITFKANTDVLLDAVPATATSSGGCEAEAGGPSEVKIAWPHGGGVHITLGRGSGGIGGTTYALDPYIGPPRLEAALGAVVFPYTIAPARLDAAMLSTDAVTFSGTTDLAGGWALSIVRPPPATPLSEALGPGFYLFRCGAALFARRARAAAETRLTDVVIAVQQGQLVILSTHASNKPEVDETLRLWATRDEADAPRIPLTLHFGADGIFVYICNAGTGESLYRTCTADVLLDRPVTITGVPLEMKRAARAFVLIDGAATAPRIRIGALSSAVVTREPRVLLALTNALVDTTQPMIAFVDGTLRDDTSVDKGTLTLALGAYEWEATLPDPYVTNHSLPRELQGFGDRSPSLVLAGVQWPSPTKPQVSFAGALPAPLGGTEPRTENPARPMQQSPEQIRVPAQTGQGALPPLKGQHPVFEPRNHEARRAPALEAIASRGGTRLLDVSTKKDLLGVDVGKEGFTIRDLDVCTTARNLRVIALPQVQWEPVRTLDRDQDINIGHFPTPLASVTDGGPTMLAVASAKLVPAIPDLAVDAVLSEFRGGKPTALFTTLPFGLEALLELRSAPSGGRDADDMQRNEPEFAHPDMRGGAQLAFIAESGPSGRADSSFFDGATVQLPNGVSLATGAPVNISVLGSPLDPTDSVQEMFNNEFAPSGSNPRVPVTRLDVSGYGGSCFSEWLNRNAAFANAARVQFQVVVGRTALEVVKIATVLYPWGILLTRTVTIERKGGGGVIRRDSGWQAASDGLFQYPGTSYHVQPGLLRGLFAIRNIRPTGLQPIRFTGSAGEDVVLVPKFFDCRARIDGLEGAADLPANGILGFLQVEPGGVALTEGELRTLLTQQGAAGGPVDGIINVGGSGFRVRATRIEVGAGERAGGGFELVGSVRCAPVFKQDGSWAAVRAPGPSNPQPDAEVVNANDVHGLPVVREGELTGVDPDGTMHVAAPSDYRFCDPADLHRPIDPQFEYGFLQTSPAHAFFFPRPHVDAGVRELRTRSVPRLADTLARSTSKGVFPPAANAITLPSNALMVDGATGGFRLRDAVNLPAPRPPLTIAQLGSDQMQIDYSGSTLAFAFDQQSWSLDFRGIEMWTDCLGIQRVAGMRTHLVAGTSARPVMTDVQVLLLQLIEDALTFLGGLGNRPSMGPIDLNATNTQHETEISIIVDKDFDVDVVKFTVGGKVSFGFMTDDAPPPGGATSGQKIGLVAVAGVEGDIPIEPPFVLVLGADLEIGGHVKKDNVTPSWILEFLLDVKAYIGIGIKAGIFEGSLAIGYHLAIEASTVKNGVFAQLKAEVNLEVVKVGVEGELGGLWYNDTTHPPNRHASDLQGEIQINVDLLFIGIHVSVEFTETKFFA
jgi:hypothetical protein